MGNIKPKQIVWLLPFAYLLHLCDEYFSGEGFAKWFSGLFEVSLSINDFIIINLFGFAATLLIAILYSFKRINNFIIAALAALFFVNGLIHLAASIFTLSYSPGTITGVILYLPLGVLIFKNIFPLLPEEQRSLSVFTGAAIQILVAVIALSI